MNVTVVDDPVTDSITETDRSVTDDSVADGSVTDGSVMDGSLKADPNPQPQRPVPHNALARLFSPGPSSSPSRTPGAGLAPGAIARLSPTALAYIGDAVYELHIRSQFLFPPQRQQAYHQKVVAQVKAEQQALTLVALEPLLTEDEKNWVRRGRNSVSKRSRHNNPVAYQNATGLETLIGYLFLVTPERLATLLEYLGTQH